jgi:hypothetical protein
LPRARRGDAPGRDARPEYPLKSVYFGDWNKLNNATVQFSCVHDAGAVSYHTDWH